MNKEEIIEKMHKIVNRYKVKQVINIIILIIMFIVSFTVFIAIKDLNPSYSDFRKIRAWLSVIFLVLMAFISIGIRMLAVRRNSTCDLLNRIEKANYCISRKDLINVVKKSSSLVKWFS